MIEGYGVDPDIDVENDPKSVIAGQDPQLERAVAEVMKRMKEKPFTLAREAGRTGQDRTEVGSQSHCPVTVHRPVGRSRDRR